jgi:single-strand DNA-binding protein
MFAPGLSTSNVLESKFVNSLNGQLNYLVMYAISNKVNLIGHLGNAPEIKTFHTGKKMARFSMATNEIYKNANGEKVKETQWHTLVAWGKLADIAEKYLTKGREIAVEGKLVNRTYNDKEGNKKYTTEVQVNELMLLGSKKD